MRLGDLVELLRSWRVAAAPLIAGLPGVIASGRIEPHDTAALVHHLQPPADVHGRSRDDIALLDHRQLCGAAADVDVEDALVVVVRDQRGARAVGGQHRLHVVAGGGGDEVAALLGQEPRDRLGVLAAQRLTGEDDHAGVDVLRLDAGGRVGLIDDGAELAVVDALVALIRRERHRRLIERFPRHHVVAAGQVLAVAAQIDAGEDHLGAGGADIDPDGGERHVILEPDRVVFQPLVRIELEMVVVVIGVAVVIVNEVLAEQVVGQSVLAARFLVVRVGHRPATPHTSHNFLGRASYAIPCAIPHPGEGKTP